jgi:hypothetical protein
MEKDANKSAIENLATRISSVHPLIYLIVYLAMIPVFATGYYLMPPGLYAPYARFEAGAATDALNLGKTFEGAIRRSLALKKDGAVVVSGWKLRPETLNIQGISSSDGSALTFVLRAFFRGEDTATERHFFIGLPVSLQADVNIVVGKDPQRPDYFMRPLETTVEKHAADIRAFEEAAFREMLRSYEEPSLLVPALMLQPNEEVELRRYFEGAKGNAVAISGAWWRTVYFSSIVITTVGFGDIVPITPLARMLVAFEAVLGIALAGLFLNAIAYRASRARVA